MYKENAPKPWTTRPGGSRLDRRLHAAEEKKSVHDVHVATVETQEKAIV